MNNSLTAWVSMKTGDITPNSPDKTTMTEIKMFEGSIPLVAGVNLFTINLTEPIIYDGTSDLRVYFEGTKGSYATVTFDYDNNYKNMYWGSSSTALANPLLYVTLAAQSATLAGKVQTSAGASIANATVTLKAENGVQYSGVTDTEGNYSINVIQAGLDFTATVEAAGFLKRQFALNMGGASATQNVTLFKQIGLVGTFPGFPAFDSEGSDLVMTQSADDPNIFTYEVKNVALDGTTYEYKLRADGKWATALADGYELPSSGNNNWGFGTKMYPAGTYNLTFTADMTNHTLNSPRKK